MSRCRHFGEFAPIKDRSTPRRPVRIAPTSAKSCEDCSLPRSDFCKLPFPFLGLIGRFEDRPATLRVGRQFPKRLGFDEALCAYITSDERLTEK
jgi:hypothetical protein